ncbi:MAG: SDR family oxidoreductase [Rhodospirillales bacterium]|jgi:NAD(P)-dependent dehydrogenase (short-subunit alcohol dehydrogenase family)|nr:SDR family oxidoreductase [Rhodospirillales bacterium]
MTELTDKIALVTGGAGGIGSAIVREFADAGARVVLHYREGAERACALADALGPDRCYLVQADFGSDDGVLELWRAAVGWRGGIDILVNNAALHARVDPEADFEEWNAVWRRSFQVNVFAAAHLCREAVAHFRGRGGGVVINISSQAAHKGSHADFMHYAAAKAALKALTQSIARAYAPEGVFAYVLAPGFVRRPEGHAGPRPELPMGEAPAEEIAAFARFLASGNARHATGATVDITGASYIR